MNNNNDATTDFYNDLVLATAVRLIKDEGYTTTLDIKNELRNRHATIDVGPITFRPNFTQNIVSDAMAILADNSYFSYEDNGTYRTYYLNTIEFGEQEDKPNTDSELTVPDDKVNAFLDDIASTLGAYNHQVGKDVKELLNIKRSLWKAYSVVHSTTLNVSQYDALEAINELEKGDKITITFTKLDGNVRTIIGNVHTPNTLGLGSIEVFDNNLPDGIAGYNIRPVDLRRLISFELNNKTYIVDKNLK